MFDLRWWKVYILGTRKRKSLQWSAKYSETVAISNRSYDRLTRNSLLRSILLTLCIQSRCWQVCLVSIWFEIDWGRGGSVFCYCWQQRCLIDCFKNWKINSKGLPLKIFLNVVFSYSEQPVNCQCFRILLHRVNMLATVNLHNKIELHYPWLHRSHRSSNKYGFEHPRSSTSTG